MTGSGFTGVTKVTFANVAGTNLVVANDSVITVTSPPNTPKVANVVVTSPDGTSAAVPADTFTYLVPAVTGVFPNSSPFVGRHQRRRDRK